MNLIIIESPGKIKKLRSFLPEGYEIEASAGHITEIPKRGLNITIEDGVFRPRVALQKRKSYFIDRIKSAAESADEIIICTDPDREGERIAFDIATMIGADWWIGVSFTRRMSHDLKTSPSFPGVTDIEKPAR